MRVQTRVASCCAAQYLGMHATDCSKVVTQLYAKTSTEASLVWLLEPVYPDAPTITNATVANSTLSILVTPPTYQGSTSASHAMMQETCSLRVKMEPEQPRSWRWLPFWRMSMISTAMQPHWLEATC